MHVLAGCIFYKSLVIFIKNAVIYCFMSFSFANAFFSGKFSQIHQWLSRFVQCESIHLFSLDYLKNAHTSANFYPLNSEKISQQHKLLPKLSFFFFQVFTKFNLKGVFSRQKWGFYCENFTVFLFKTSSLHSNLSHC